MSSINIVMHLQTAINSDKVWAYEVISQNIYFEAQPCFFLLVQTYIDLFIFNQLLIFCLSFFVHDV